jgi:hypothetical protein
MTKTLLVLGPAGAGRSGFIETLACEHPDHRWHLVQLEERAEQAAGLQPIMAPRPGWAGVWHLRYRREEVLTALPELIERIQADSPAQPSVIALAAAPDPLLRHAYAYDLRVFIVSPIDDEAALFRSHDEARLALRQICRDSSAFSAEILAAGQDLVDGDPSLEAMALPSLGGGGEVNESQVDGFLAQPLGVELAMRVHLQPRFAAMADADIIILDVAAESSSERALAWQRLLALLERVRKAGSRGPLTYACDLSDPQDPCFVRIRRRMAEVLCKV